MKSVIKALIFDLDGTLADTIPAITEAVNMTLTELGFPERSESEVTRFIGKGPRHLISESLPAVARLENKELVDTALALYDKMYAKTYMHTSTLYSGMLDALRTLSDHYIIAVLSNKQDEYVKALAAQLLPEGICAIARGSLAGVPAKPEPTVANKVIDALGVKPGECVMIGDSEIDILTAKNAKMDILSVSWGYAPRERLITFGAKNVIDSPIELVNYFIN